jgi:hypothetical protein
MKRTTLDLIAERENKEIVKLRDDEFIKKGDWASLSDSDVTEVLNDKMGLVRDNQELKPYLRLVPASVSREDLIAALHDIISTSPWEEIQSLTGLSEARCKEIVKIVDATRQDHTIISFYHGRRRG